VSLTDALLHPYLTGPAAARPLLTHYDDATGERTELSATTTANWAAKSANLLRDECDVEPGTRVTLLLPAHWQSAAVLLAAWSCGAVVTGPPGVGAEAEVVLTDAEQLPRARALASGAVVALSLDPFGRGLPDLPGDVVDFATQVRLHGDEFLAWEPVGPEVVALGGHTVAQVLAQARDRAAARGLSRGDRVLSTLDWDTPDGLGDGLLAVLAAGASLVQCRHPDPAAVDARADAERVTHRL